jgi:hypothetical protein
MCCVISVYTEYLVDNFGKILSIWHAASTFLKMKTFARILRTEGSSGGHHVTSWSWTAMLHNMKSHVFYVRHDGWSVFIILASALFSYAEDEGSKCFQNEVNDLQDQTSSYPTRHQSPHAISTAKRVVKNFGCCRIWVSQGGSSTLWYIALKANRSFGGISCLYIQVRRIIK